jgi:hypothetical protein
MGFFPSFPSVGDLVPPVTVPDGGTGLTTLTADALLAGGLTSASPLQQIPAGTAGQFLKSAGAGALPGFAGVPGQLLALNVYAPTTQALKTTTSATMAAVDSTNAQTGAFTVPASGSVVVLASLVAQVSAVGDAIAFGLAAHGTVTPLVGTSVVTKLATTYTPQNYRFSVTGLTPGASVNLDLLFAIAAAGTLTVAAFNNTSVTPTLGGATTGAPIIISVQEVG